jgi:hypothetical protein
MAAVKLSVTVESHVAEGARAAAAGSGESLSAYVTEAVSRRLRQDALRAAVQAFEDAHGPFSAEERRQARETADRLERAVSEAAAASVHADSGP